MATLPKAPAKVRWSPFSSRPRFQPNKNEIKNEIKNFRNELNRVPLLQPRLGQQPVRHGDGPVPMPGSFRRQTLQSLQGNKTDKIKMLILPNKNVLKFFWKFSKDGYGNIEAGCRDCQCDLVGSLTASTCDVQTGQCNCKPGVGTLACNQCLEDHYDFSINGCQGKKHFLFLYPRPSGVPPPPPFSVFVLIETKQNKNGGKEK